MQKLLVTVKPFQGTIPFRILQRGRVLVEGSFSGKCTQLHSRTFQVNATNEELTVECTMNAAKCRMVSAAATLLSMARYCRRIPVLTETAARQGDSSARVCGDNQKRYTPGFTALTERGVVPSWSLVRCDGGRNRTMCYLARPVMSCV